MKRYYVADTRYVGPNQHDDRYIDADRIYIRTQPAITNMSYQPIDEGWAGETDGWSTHAHGAYDTVEDAEAAITRIFGAIREYETDLDWEQNPDILRVYRPGKLEPVGREATDAYAWEQVHDEVTATTTDEQAETMVTAIMEYAETEGFRLNSLTLERMIEARRDELQA